MCGRVMLLTCCSNAVGATLKLLLGRLIGDLGEICLILLAVLKPESSLLLLARNNRACALDATELSSFCPFAPVIAVFALKAQDSSFAMDDGVDVGGDRFMILLYKYLGSVVQMSRGVGK